MKDSYETHLLRVAVHQAKVAIVGTGSNQGGSTPAPRQVATDNNHPFILGLDAAGDPKALPTKTGY